jgi:CRISPR-associated endonuclease/helicase Cas3
MVHVYGLGQGPWGDDVDFPTFARQVYEGLEATQMEADWLADLVGFRGAYAISTREDEYEWFNQELRTDFAANIEQYNRWRRFIADVEREHDEIQTGFEPGKYTDKSDEAKLLRFTKQCFEAFRGLRGRSLSAAIKYPRGDRRGLTTYDLTTTLRYYDIDSVEDDNVLVVRLSDDDSLSVVTARLPAYETHPTQWNKPTSEIEKHLQRKMHRHIDQAELNSEFEVSTELLHRFFDIIRITDAIVPERITTAEYELEVNDGENGPPTIDARRRQI